MTQSDLSMVLGLNGKRTSEVIASINGGRKKKHKEGLEKISEIREHLGKRNSGKIRYLSRTGLEYAASLLGQSVALMSLKEGEARTVANLAKVALALARSNPSAIYQGPYLAQLNFPFDDIRSEPLACLMTEKNLYWTIWIHDAMEDTSIRERLDKWRHIQSKAMMMDSIFNHHVMAICSDAMVEQKVNELALRVKPFLLHVTTIARINEIVID